MKTMPKNIQQERYRWIKPILDNQLKIKTLTDISPFSERTIKYWLSAYRKYGIKGLKPRSTRPKSHPNETPIRVKEEVIELRKKSGLCAKKLKWRYNLTIHERTIGKIINQEGLVRKYRKKKIKYKYIKVKRIPGELMEIDVKYVPGRVKGQRYYQYTAIDVSSRWRYLKIYEEQSSFHSIKFLEEVVEIFPFKIQSIKTDNHSTFTNYYVGTTKRSDMTVKRIHGLDVFCAKNNIVHYLIDPGKPAQNGTVERSHREDEEKFYQKRKFKTVEELKCKVKLWNMYYNDLEHCSLDGLTPNQFLSLSKVQNVRT